MNISVPNYDEKGFKFLWEDDAAIKCTVNGNTILIEANRDGLISLARHMLELSQDMVPDGTHFHLDEDNSLEDGSVEMIVVKKKY